MTPDMRATVGRRMSRMKVVCALIVGALALPATAGAQEGNGPYAPFPSVSDAAPGDAWYALMDVDIPSARLDAGAFAGSLRAPAGADTAASARAGVDVSGTGAGALLAALALALTALIAAALTARRQPGTAIDEPT